MFKSLLKIADVGEKQMGTFVRGALDSDGTHSFISPVKKSGIRTCADITKKVKFKTGKGGTITASISPEIVFHRALSLARWRDDASVAAVLHPVRPMPVLFFHAGGTMKKMDAAEIEHQMEYQAERLHVLRPCSKETRVYSWGNSAHKFSGLYSPFILK